MILEIKHVGDEVLRQVAEPVDLSIEFEKTAALVRDMIETVKDKKGVGLAAPQVGISKCVIVVKDPDTDEFFPMINPEIIWTSFDQEAMQEGCLSVVDEFGKPIHKPRMRYTRITVKYKNLAGIEQETMIKNHLLSRIIQHETDHLKGILFID